MKKIFNLLLLVVIGLGLVTFTACTDDGGEGAIEDCNVSSKVQKLYNDDATRLALKEMETSNIDEITIPPALIDRMLNVLSTVYGSDSTERDTVVSIYEIHTLEASELNKVNLTVSTDTIANPWLANWANEERLTGNADVDALMSVYGLELSSYQKVNLSDTESAGLVVIMSTSPVNLNALASRFLAVDGIDFASTELDGATDGNDISVTSGVTSSDFVVTYTVAYDSLAGICDNACQFRRDYTFDVNLADCEATFTGATGDPAPPVEE